MNLSPVAFAPASHIQPAPPVEAPTPSVPPTPSAVADRGARYVGMPLHEALQQAQASGEIVRVTVKDGEPQIVTMDYRPERINVAVEAGTITDILGHG